MFNRKLLRLSLVASLTTLVVAGCSDEGVLEVSNDLDQVTTVERGSFSKFVLTDPETDVKKGTFTVCKSATDDVNQEFVFLTTFDDNGPFTDDPTIVSPAVLKDGECEDVAVSHGHGDTIHIEELVPAGWVTPIQSVLVWNIDENGAVTGPFEHAADLVGNTLTGVIERGKAGCLVIFVNKTEVIEELPGRITGGGSIFLGDIRFTHGLELHCDANDPPNNLEINWDGHRFHLEQLTSAVCTNDPLIDERPPVAGFDTYEGVGVGRLNGVPGAAIEFKLTDAGQPGRNDTAWYKITPPGGGTPVEVAGNLDRGNHQTHRH